MSNEFWLSMSDGTEIHIQKWETTARPKAIVQISHGMTEHIARYQDFAVFLNQQGIAVYGNDHRGHGKTGERQGLLGHFADHDGFNRTAEDLYAINQHIRAAYPGIPVFLFGHSMGSFLARHYIQTHSASITGVILSGTGFFTKAAAYSGYRIASMLPDKKPSKLMNSIAFGTYNKHITPKQTSFDWLTRDDQIVNQYVNDPFCGYIPTAKFFADLMSGLSGIHQVEQNQQIRSDLPMLFISGDADPVGNYGKGVWKTAAYYRNLGISNINVSLYDEARHEILNEINKDEVYARILKWIKEQQAFIQ